MTLTSRQTLSDLWSDTFMRNLLILACLPFLLVGIVLLMTEEVIPQPLGAVFIILTILFRRSCNVRIHRVLENNDQRD